MGDSNVAGLIKEFACNPDIQNYDLLARIFFGLSKLCGSFPSDEPPRLALAFDDYYLALKNYRASYETLEKAEKDLTKLL